MDLFQIGKRDEVVNKEILNATHMDFLFLGTNVDGKMSMPNTGSDNKKKLSEIIDDYTKKKMSLANFLTAIPDFYDVGQSKRLRKLEAAIEASFDEFIQFDKHDIESSLQKLDFVIDEFSINTDLSSIANKALKSTLNDIKNSTHKLRSEQYENRRESARVRKNVFGTFFAENWDTCPCLVKDVSADGVCLIVQNSDVLSEKFKFTGLGDRGVVDAVEVWRKDNEIGARIMKCTPVQEAWWSSDEVH